MRIPSLIKTLAVALTLAATPWLASAQNYPSKPIKIIVPFGPGTATDTIARVVGAAIGNRTGQAVVIENKPGASGNIGTELVAKSPADGYTLLQVVTPHVINPALYSNLSFDFMRDIAPVIYGARLAYVVVVNPSVPATTIPEFIAYAKANPGKLNFASSGNGSIQHIAGELFKQLTGTFITHIPYRGSGPAVQDLMAGQVLASLTRHGVGETTAIRVVDHAVSPGVERDMGSGDDWRPILDAVLDADILVFATPTWVGHASSVAQRVLERLSAEISTTDEGNRPVLVGKVALCAVVGNEDGAHKIVADTTQALTDIGFSVGARGSTYWNDEAMGGHDYIDLDHTPPAVARTTDTAARNAAHLAALLRASPYPAYPES